ncbi:MAG: cation-translocating P-type ATPase [Promethearchaeati archaeon]
MEIDQNYYKLRLDSLYEELDTDPTKGLTEKQVQERIQQYGYNELPEYKRSFVKIYLAPLFNWLIVIYLLGALILLLASLLGFRGNLLIVALTLGIVLLNCLVAIIQQFRAQKKLKALQELAAPTTTVIREGKKMEIPTREVTKGDLLVINQGDKIPADARIVSGTNLELNEASLTGESEPVKKDSEGKAIEDTRPIQDRKNMIFYGTYVTMGNGRAISVKIGGETEIGKISEGLKKAGTTEIPIQKKMNHFGKWLGIAVIVLWLVILFFKWVTRGFTENEIVISLNSALDILPINIPLLITIVLLTGVLAMAREGVIIRNLASVDSLGRVSVVCSDKTGTLTKNQMAVQHIYSNGSIFKITGSGYKPEGEIVNIDDKKNPSYIKHIEDYPFLKLLLISGFLNNNSALVKSEIESSGKGAKIINNWKVIGSPTEGALVVLFQKIMGDYLLEDYDFVKEYPFDSSIKRMTKIYKKDEKNYSFSKGASEILIPRCNQICYKGTEKEFTDELRKEVNDLIQSYASQGYRVLSFCYKDFYMLPELSDENRDKFESDMVYLGFVTILDPPREGVRESVETCEKAGVKTLMITGDSKITAEAIAKQISIIKNENDKVIEGSQINELESSEEFNHVKVFARVSPKNKEDIIKRYKEENRVVAMTGDGVNDSLALNMADVGIAMGIQGTDVAKEASDMVISDDSFNSIVTGIQKGRGIFSKIRAIVFFYICINLFEGIVQFILAVIFELPYFLKPEIFYFQWIFLSITLHTFPGLILTFDKTSGDVMNEKPRNSEEILSKNTILLLFAFGILLTISMLLVYFITITGAYPLFPENYEFGEWNDFYLYTSGSEFGTLTDRINGKTLTMLMVTLFFCETSLVFQIRRPNKSLLKSLKEDRTRLMFSITGFLFAILIMLIYIPGVQTTLAAVGINFMFMFLTWQDWLVCFLISLICIISFEIVKYYGRKNDIIF